MGAMDPRISAAYESCRRLQLRHDPTYYWATRRLPAEVRPATHALYGFVRTADQIVDGPRPPADPGGAAGRARRVGGGAARRPLLAPGGDRADRRRRAARPAARRARRLHALDARRLRAGPDRQRRRARRLYGRVGGLGRPDHGPAARRAGPLPPRLRAARPGVPARELHPRRGRGLGAGPHLPAGAGRRGSGDRPRDAAAARRRRPAGRARPGAVRRRRAGRRGRAGLGAAPGSGSRLPPTDASSIAPRRPVATCSAGGSACAVRDLPVLVVRR